MTLGLLVLKFFGVVTLAAIALAVMGRVMVWHDKKMEDE